MLECNKVDKSEGIMTCVREGTEEMFGQDMTAFKFVTNSKERFDYLCEIERKCKKVQKTVGVDPGVGLEDSNAQGGSAKQDPQEGIKRRYQQTSRKSTRVIQFAKNVIWILMTLNP